MDPTNCNMDDEPYLQPTPAGEAPQPTKSKQTTMRIKGNGQSVHYADNAVCMNQRGQQEEYLQMGKMPPNQQSSSSNNATDQLAPPVDQQPNSGREPNTENSCEPQRSAAEACDTTNSQNNGISADLSDEANAARPRSHLPQNSIPTVSANEPPTDVTTKTPSHIQAGTQHTDTPNYWHTGYDLQVTSVFPSEAVPTSQSHYQHMVGLLPVPEQFTTKSPERSDLLLANLIRSNDDGTIQAVGNAVYGGDNDAQSYPSRHEQGPEEKNDLDTDRPLPIPDGFHDTIGTAGSDASTHHNEAREEATANNFAQPVTAAKAQKTFDPLNGSFKELLRKTVGNP